MSCHIFNPIAKASDNDSKTNEEEFLIINTLVEIIVIIYKIYLCKIRTQL